MFQVDPIGILALTEGDISNKERTLLNHLRDSLGISPVDAEAFEHELQQRSSPGISLPV